MGRGLNPVVDRPLEDQIIARKIDSLPLQRLPVGVARALKKRVKGPRMRVLIVPVDIFRKIKLRIALPHPHEDRQSRLRIRQDVPKQGRPAACRK